MYKSAVLILFFVLSAALSPVHGKDYIIVLNGNESDSNVEQLEFDEEKIIDSVNVNGSDLLKKIDELAACEEETQISYEKLWITNSLRLSASPEVIEKIRDDGSIKTIFEDFEIITDSESADAADDQEPLDVSEDEELLEALPDAEWGIRYIGAPKVWMQFQARGQGVRIGIIDTGINHSHEVLKGKLLRYRNFYNNNQVPHDDNGHGSQVASIIAGTKNGEKFAGVAPEAKLIVAKVTDPQGRMMYSNFMKAMQWMIDPDGNPKTPDRPAAVNCSLHFPSISCKEAMDHFNGLCQNLLKFNIIPVFGAGNDFTEKNLPIYFLNNSPYIITVGAVGMTGKRAPFSRIGNAGSGKPDMVAPGDRIPGADALANKGLVLTKGTSMAAPHVTGVIALIKSIRPKLTCQQIINILKSSCVDIGPKGFDTLTGRGCINAEIAVKKAIAIK